MKDEKDAEAKAAKTRDVETALKERETKPNKEEAPLPGQVNALSKKFEDKAKTDRHQMGSSLYALHQLTATEGEI